MGKHSQVTGGGGMSTGPSHGHRFYEWDRDESPVQLEMRMDVLRPASDDGYRPRLSWEQWIGVYGAIVGTLTLAVVIAAMVTR